MGQPGFVGADPLDRPIPESVEGYVALFGPTTAGPEQTYHLVVGVTKVKYPDNPKRQSVTSGFRTNLQVTLPDLLPAPKRPLRTFTSEDGEERWPVSPGQDYLLSSNTVQTPGGKERSVIFRLRFLTPEELEELAAAGR